MFEGYTTASGFVAAVTDITGSDSAEKETGYSIRDFAETLKPTIKKIIINVNKIFD